MFKINTNANKNGRKICYISGIDNHITLGELEKAIEAEYPLDEGKVFINIAVLITQIRNNPDTYTTLNLIKSDRYLKSVIAEVMRTDFQWTRFAASNGRGGVFQRILSTTV